MSLLFEIYTVVGLIFGVAVIVTIAATFLFDNPIKKTIHSKSTTVTKNKVFNLDTLQWESVK